jgi:hypothetical protein
MAVTQVLMELTLFKAKFGVTVGGYKTSKTKV